MKYFIPKITFENNITDHMMLSNINLSSILSSVKAFMRLNVMNLFLYVPILQLVKQLLQSMLLLIH